MPRESVGVFIVWPGTGPLPHHTLEELTRYAAGLPGVAHVETLRPPLPPDPVTLAATLRILPLEAVVLAGADPGYVKPAVARALALAGKDPERLRLASFREHGRGPTATLERAKAVLACAVLDVPFGIAAQGEAVSTHPATLVIGGGVAGIQAALEIADAGQLVYLVERSGTIGGHMAMFDKTFPTLDCAACILTPKMVAVAQHENIRLMTCTDVLDVGGSAGAYAVRLRSRARRVDVSDCVVCHACVEVCPVSVPSEFDAGISTRKAIYLPFPQAVPNSYLVDPDACTWVQTDGRKCGACLRKCTKHCIHLEEQDRMFELEVGHIIVATGYDVFDARRVARYGYGAHPNVLTALEFERLTNASGPTGGRIVLRTRRFNRRRKADEWVFDPGGPSPRRLAIIHCVGSRDRHYNPYCSRVCCMYSLKFAHLVREKLPDAECREFYIDMRAFGKGYEEFFERIRQEGVFVVRGRSASVEMRGDDMFVKGEDIVGDRVVEFPVDMVLLAVGLQPDAECERLASTLGIARDDDGWLSELHYNSDPTGTVRGGIFVAGVCQGPKDIPDTVAQASAVAARVLGNLVKGAAQQGQNTASLQDIERRALALASPSSGGWHGGESQPAPR
jgi:heterodisulfide reductase subunit A2